MAHTVKRFTMLPAIALVLSALSLAIVLGWPPLPTGIWPGITLGLFGVLAALSARREGARSHTAKWVIWAALLLGLGAALLGLTAYLGLIVMTGQLG